MSNLFGFLDPITLPATVGDLLRDDSDLRGIRYGKYFPKSVEEVPAIRYRLVHRVPGINRIETRKPRYRLSVKDEDGKTLEVWSQWMTCVYQWDICAASLEEADSLTEQFDRFLRVCVGRLIQQGARDFIFDEQVEDTLLPKVADVETRSLRWIGYLHQLEARVVDPIDQVRIRVLAPTVDAVEAVVRGADNLTPDPLVQTYISHILFVSDPSPSGIARQEDYIPGVDFDTVYDPANKKTWLLWIPAGRNPAPGATYYVRYLYWNAWTRLSLPTPLDFHYQFPFPADDL